MDSHGRAPVRAALNHLDKTPAGTSTDGSNVGTINFAGLLPTSLMGWYYQGSLTTPPLSQVVNWLVLSTPITLDDKEVELDLKLGSIEAKRKFNLKDMVYNGKLEL